jgi:ribose/xylose/arabinose/galactoside ABC-type transport system permease subunit
VLRRTVLGRYVYAAGSNPESARLAGVPVTRVLVSVYAIAGLLAAVGGVLFTSRLAINSFYLQIIIGALILAAVAFDQWQGRRARSA